MHMGNTGSIVRTGEMLQVEATNDSEIQVDREVHTAFRTAVRWEVLQFC